MNRKAIEDMIIKYNLFFDNGIFVIYSENMDRYNRTAYVQGIDDYESGFYPKGDPIQIDLYWCPNDLDYLLSIFGGVIFNNGDIMFCNDSWDGYQPEVTIKDYYKEPKKDPLERIF